MKICTKCGAEKQDECFYLDSRAPDGFRNPCKECSGKTQRAYRKKEQGKDNLFFQRNNLKYRFGITPEEKQEMLRAQGGKCAICGEVISNSRNAHADHIHGSKPVIVRGILCLMCNVGLGNFKDSPVRLREAANFIERFQCPPK